MTASRELRAVAGDAVLTAVDAGEDEARGLARDVLVEAVADGYLDAPPALIEQLARKIAKRVRLPLKRAVFVTWQYARNYGEPPEAHDAPTRPGTPAPRKDPDHG